MTDSTSRREDDFERKVVSLLLQSCCVTESSSREEIQIMPDARYAQSMNKLQERINQANKKLISLQSNAGDGEIAMASGAATVALQHGPYASNNSLRESLSRQPSVRTKKRGRKRKKGKDMPIDQHRAHNFDALSQQQTMKGQQRPGIPAEAWGTKSPSTSISEAPVRETRKMKQERDSAGPLVPTPSVSPGLKCRSRLPANGNKPGMIVQKTVKKTTGDRQPNTVAIAGYVPALHYSKRSLEQAEQMDINSLHERLKDVSFQHAMRTCGVLDSELQPKQPADFLLDTETDFLPEQIAPEDAKRRWARAEKRRVEVLALVIEEESSQQSAVDPTTLETSVSTPCLGATLVSDLQIYETMSRTLEREEARQISIFRKTKSKNDAIAQANQVLVGKRGIFEKHQRAQQLREARRRDAMRAGAIQKQMLKEQKQAHAEHAKREREAMDERTRELAEEKRRLAEERVQEHMRQKDLQERKKGEMRKQRAKHREAVRRQMAQREQDRVRQIEMKMSAKESHLAGIQSLRQIAIRRKKEEAHMRQLDKDSNAQRIQRAHQYERERMIEKLKHDAENFQAMNNLKEAIMRHRRGAEKQALILKHKQKEEQIMWERNQEPGPGHYHVKSAIGSNPRRGFSIANERPKSELDFQIARAAAQPGPGSYQPSLPNPRNLGGTFTKGHVMTDVDWKCKHAAETPGPGAFVSNQFRPSNRGFVMGRGHAALSDLDRQIRHAAALPGPGEYYGGSPQIHKSSVKELKATLAKRVQALTTAVESNSPGGSKSTSTSPPPERLLGTSRNRGGRGGAKGQGRGGGRQSAPLSAPGACDFTFSRDEGGLTGCTAPSVSSPPADLDQHAIARRERRSLAKSISSDLVVPLVFGESVLRAASRVAKQRGGMLEAPADSALRKARARDEQPPPPKREQGTNRRENGEEDGEEDGDGKQRKEHQRAPLTPLKTGVPASTDAADAPLPTTFLLRSTEQPSSATKKSACSKSKGIFFDLRLPHRATHAVSIDALIGSIAPGNGTGTGTGNGKTVKSAVQIWACQGGSAAGREENASEWKLVGVGDYRTPDAVAGGSRVELLHPVILRPGACVGFHVHTHQPQLKGGAATEGTEEEQKLLLSDEGGTAYLAGTHLLQQYKQAITTTSAVENTVGGPFTRAQPLVEDPKIQTKYLPAGAVEYSVIS